MKTSASEYRILMRHASIDTGLLDEVRLYGRALTADEVRRHFGQFPAKRVMNREQKP
jgi:hypothetical protein